MIHVKNVNYKYKNNIVLENLSLEIGNGMIGLLGENGAGKTTLMKLICTLNKMQNGEIKLDGVKICSKNYNTIRKMIGFMPQEFGFYNYFTVFEMLEYMCLLENVPQRDITNVIKNLTGDLNLTKYLRKKTKELSGGMKRRLGLACALINNPQILVVDEPTVGLDPEERINMRNILKKYSINRTVLFSTHIVEDINSICEKVVILSKGKLLYDGNVIKLIENSPNVYEIDCSFERIEYYKNIGTITDIKYTENSCFLKIVSDNSELENEKKIEKTLGTAYMHLLNADSI